VQQQAALGSLQAGQDQNQNQKIHHEDTKDTKKSEVNNGIRRTCTSSCPSCPSCLRG